jgi:hypothetical protein
MSLTLLLTNFLNKLLDIVLPNNGITFRLIDIASKAPSHIIIGRFQFINNSKPIMSLLVDGAFILLFSSSK